MAVSVILFLFFLQSSAFSSPMEIHQDSPTSRTSSLLSQIQEAKRKLEQLDSNLQKCIKDFNGKIFYNEECEEKVEEMTVNTDPQRTSGSVRKNFGENHKDDYSGTNEKLDTLERELQNLRFASRINKFQIRTLEFKVQRAQERLNEAKSQVEKMAGIVSEQWIQIQQLEQAVQMTQSRVLKIEREVRAARWSFVKFINDSWISTLESCISEVPGCLRKTFSAAKYYHQKLQGFIKQSMLQNEITAVLVNEEVVFFLASVLFTFPVLMCLFGLLPSHFG